MKYLGQESSQLEFKRELPSLLQIVKTVIGFCNHFGGKIILKMFDTAKAITSKDLVHHLKISRQTAYRILSDLVQKGFLKKIGKGTGMSYILSH